MNDALRYLRDGLAGVLCALCAGACERADWDPTLRVSSARGHLLDAQAQARRRANEKGAYTHTVEIHAYAGHSSQASPVPEIWQRGTGQFIGPVTPRAGSSKAGVAATGSVDTSAR